jgi:hypothetical protein
VFLVVAVACSDAELLSRKSAPAQVFPESLRG